MEDGTTIHSGWNWSFQKGYRSNRSRVLSDSMTNSFPKINKSLEDYVDTKPKFISAQIAGRWTELFFENDHSFHFYEWPDGAALSLCWPNCKYLDIYNQKEIYHGSFVINEASYPVKLARHLPGKPKRMANLDRYQDKYSHQLSRI